MRQLAPVVLILMLALLLFASVASAGHVPDHKQITSSQSS